MLASFFHATLLKHENLSGALSYILANKLADPIMPAIAIREVAEEAYRADPCMVDYAARDILAVRQRDPAVDKYYTLVIPKGVPCATGVSYRSLVMAPGATSLGYLFTESNLCGVRRGYSPCGPYRLRHHAGSCHWYRHR